MAHVALYSPYLPKTKGGGEKYLLSIAEVASRHCRTSILVPPALLEETKHKLPEYGKIFGLNLNKVEVLASGIGTSRGPVQTILATKRFSHFFAMTDGSIFPSTAAKSYFIAQVPWTRRLSAPERLKLATWTKVLVYDSFVRDVLRASWKVKAIDILSPYVDLDDFQPGEKQPIILNVGRFFRHTTSNSKRQDVAIEAFKKMVDKEMLPGYSLVLAGNVDPDPDSLAYLDELKASAYGYHVNILTDLSYPQLKRYYSQALIYWHAAGFGVDAGKNPENTEHFGMTTLEAMSSGAIPLVVPYGGQREIVGDDRLFWESVDELSDKMGKLLHMKKKDLKELSGEMRRKAGKYSKHKFEEAVENLL